jgi:MFS family permease
MMAPDEQAVVHARRSVAGTFFLNGFTMATWFTEIPRFSERLAAEPGTLAFALVAPTVGALASMQVVGPLTARVGSRVVVRVASVLLPVTLLGVSFAGSLVPAIVMLLLLGALDGALDVAANRQGVEVERALGRPALNGLHGAWGVGAILGGAVSSAVFALEVSQRWHFALVTALLVPLGWFCGRRLLEVREPEHRTEPRRGFSSWLSGWTTRVLVLGAIGAAGMLTEGAVSNWIGVFLRDYKDAAAALAAAGYTVFTLTETLARYAADRVTERLGPVRLVWAASSLFAVGLLVILLSPSPWLAMAGLVLAGVGIAPINPLAFSAVGHSTADEADSGTAIGHYTTLSYGGLLGGPAVIGAVAAWTDLPAALALTLVAVAFIAVAAPALGRAPLRAVP